MKLHRTVLKNYAIAVLLLACGQQIFAQEDPTKPVTIDSFNVVRDYRPILADAVKIRRSPDMTNKRSYMPRLNYSDIADKKLDINTGLKELNVQELPFTRIEDLTSNYVKLGVGNFSSILAEAYLAVEDYEDIRFGGFVKHLSQSGRLEEQKFGRQELGVFGRRVLSNFTVDGVLGYNRYATRFYGIPVDENSITLNPEKEPQRFNDIYFTGELTSNYDPQNDEALSYSAKVDAYAYGDKYDAKEHSFALSGYLNKRMRTFNIGANLGVDVNALNGTAHTENAGKWNNSVFNFNPYVSFKGTNYALILGANLVSEFGDVSRFNIFPTAEIDFSLVPGYIHLFGGINGGVKKASYRALSQLNPYLGPEQSFQNAIERLNFFGGVKGNAGATFGYKAKVMYKSIEGMHLFVNNRENPFRFDVVYDGDENDRVKYFGIEGELNVRLSDVVNIGGRLNIDGYTMATQQEAWFTPAVRLAANARFNISEKIYIDAEALMHDRTSARAYIYDNSTTPTTISADYHVVSVPSFFDFSAGVEYRALKNLGIFAKANNMFNSEYQRYLYYPRLGFNLIGGVNFSF
ncbi:MAG TPA: TonB-dependent receptor [Sphingobacterium sp.]|nr:TonB-dependent receptor [Sphingobacterium sp.]